MSTASGKSNGSLFLRCNCLHLRPRRIVLRAAHLLICTDLDIVLPAALQFCDLLRGLAVSIHGYRFFTLGELLVGCKLNLVAGDAGFRHLRGLLLPLDGDGLLRLL